MSPVVLTFPSMQPVNDGKWHHITFTFISEDGEYSLTWDAVRLYAGQNYGRGRIVEVRLVQLGLY